MVAQKAQLFRNVSAAHSECQVSQRKSTGIIHFPRVQFAAEAHGDHRKMPALIESEHLIYFLYNCKVCCIFGFTIDLETCRSRTQSLRLLRMRWMPQRCCSCVILQREKSNTKPPMAGSRCQTEILQRGQYSIQSDKKPTVTCLTSIIALDRIKLPPPTVRSCSIELVEEPLMKCLQYLI